MLPWMIEKLEEEKRRRQRHSRMRIHAPSPLPYDIEEMPTQRKEGRDIGEKYKID